MENIKTILMSFLFLIFSRLCIHLLKKIRNSRGSHHGIKLPPGPWKLPFIGSLHHLYGEHPHRKLLSLATKYGPLLNLKLGEVSYIIITSPEYASEIMMTHDKDFASRPEFLASKIIYYGSTDIGFSPYGKYWSQLRKICTVELLSPKRVESLGFIREEEGENILKKIRMAKGSPVNVSAMFLSLSCMTISRAAFGQGYPQQQKFHDAMRKAFKYISGFYLVDLYPSLSFLENLTRIRAKLESVHQYLDGILDEIFEDHRAKNLNGNNTHEDIVDILFRLKNYEELDVSLTTENIKAVLLDLFLAGTDTSASTMEWAMSELIRHPDILQKAQLEVRKVFEGKENVDRREVNKLPYLKSIIKETLRLHPAGPLLIPRISYNTVEVGDYTIPAGSRIIINAWAIMRDPKYWVDPERFQPERFDEATFDFKGSKFEFIPFGAGRRICPGISFAMAGIEYWLAQLLFHFDWKLPKGKTSEELDMDEVFGLTISRKNDLVLLATPHICSPPN